MDGWEIGLFAVAAFVAITSLVKLMKTRHDKLVSKMRSQIEAEKRRKEQLAQKANRRQRRSKRAV